MGNRLAGRSAVVTGAGRGMGRAIARLLAAEGAKVVVNDPGVEVHGVGHSKGPADEVVEEIRGAGGTAVADYEFVASMESGERLIKTAVDNFGRIDILVNNAGITSHATIWEFKEAKWDMVIGVHLKGYFATIKPASILMRQQRYGRIINFTSGAGLTGVPANVAYGSAKAGIVGLTRCAALELGRSGITCNAIAPAALTRMVERYLVETGLSREGWSQRTAEHVAPWVAFLCTDEAWNINGKIFHVAGGDVGLALDEVPARTIIAQHEWEVEQLVVAVPARLTYDVANPAPPADDIDVPGRPAMATA